MDLGSLMGILNQYRNASAGAPPPNAKEDYAQVAEAAPPAHLASGLSEAFRSDETPPFEQMLSSLFSGSNGDQRAGILTKLLSSVGPGLLSSGGGLDSLSGLLRGGEPSITPEQANQVSPAAVQQLAEHARKQNPSIVDEASEFYAQHPTLVKALGAGSLALIMSHLSRK
jgi:hypothetical protein